MSTLTLDHCELVGTFYYEQRHSYGLPIEGKLITQPELLKHLNMIPSVNPSANRMSGTLAGSGVPGYGPGLKVKSVYNLIKSCNQELSIFRLVTNEESEMIEVEYWVKNSFLESRTG